MRTYVLVAWRAACREHAAGRRRLHRYNVLQHSNSAANLTAAAAAAATLTAVAASELSDQSRCRRVAWCALCAYSAERRRISAFGWASHTAGPPSHTQGLPGQIGGRGAKVSTGRTSQHGLLLLPAPVYKHVA